MPGIDFDDRSGLLRQQIPFDWQVPTGKAATAQRSLAPRVILSPLSMPHLVAGVDLAYSEDAQYAYGAAVVMKLPKFKIVDSQTVEGPVTFPYRPGLLAFREGPLTSILLRKLTVIPDVILFDGAGVAHPRRFGMASHLGVLFDIPTIGCAKTSLIQPYEKPGPRQNDFSPIVTDAKVLGAVLRTREGVNPIFISPGHRADFTSTIEITTAAITRYRSPEPIRHAHRLANQLRAESRLSR